MIVEVSKRFGGVVTFKVVKKTAYVFGGNFISVFWSIDR